MTDSDLIAAFRRGELLFLTVAEMAVMARLSRMTIYRHIEEGKLGANRYGRTYRIPVASARSYFQGDVAHDGG